jgi:hemolysin activation/secretion protein
MLCIGLLVHAIPSQAEPTAPVDNLLVKGFSFSGNTVVFQAELETITQPYVGRSLTLPELEEVAARVTDLYRQKGYTLVSTYVPQLQIRFGVVTIAILEGRVGEISVTGNQHYSTNFIRRSFAQAMEENVIRKVALERALLLLNEYPDLKVSAVLELGASTGSTNVHVTAKDKLPIHATLDYNN